MNCRLALLSIAVFLTVNCPIGGDAEVAASPTPPAAAVIAAGNVKSFDPAAATKAWLDTVPADKRAKSDRYFEGGYWLILWNFLLGAAICIFLLASGLSAKIRDRAEGITRFKTLQVLLYSLAYTLITLLLSFP